MKKENKTNINFCKQLINDVRSLLWVVTVGGLLLAFCCIIFNYTSSLPWISAMVGLPWSAHAAICSFYMVKSKAENTDAEGNGIVFAAAAAKNFMSECSDFQVQSSEEESNYIYEEDYSRNSPPI